MMDCPPSAREAVIAMRRLLALATLLAVSSAAARTITVDGDPSDWIANPTLAIHESAIVNEEWVYRGEAGDLRAFGPVESRGNYDITEVRMTADSEWLYLLVRLADITSTDDPHIGVAIDRDRSPTDSNGLDFLGDESGLTFGAIPERAPEVILSIHNAQPGITWVEYYDDAGSGSWYTNPGDSFAFISAANDVVEARMRLTSLGITNALEFNLTVVTFDNGTTADPGAVGFNNDTDTTVDYPDFDALDGVGGTPGVSANAFTRAFGGLAGVAPLANTAPLSVAALLASSVGDWMLLAD
jgi:hypothetical protein